MSFYLQFSWYTKISKKFSWIKLLVLCCGGVYYLLFTLDVKCGVTVMFICLNCTSNTQSQQLLHVCVLRTIVVSLSVLQNQWFISRGFYVLQGCMGHAHKAQSTKTAAPAVAACTISNNKKLRPNPCERYVCGNGTEEDQVTYRNKEERYSFTFETKR